MNNEQANDLAVCSKQAADDILWNNDIPYLTCIMREAVDDSTAFVAYSGGVEVAADYSISRSSSSDRII